MVRMLSVLLLVLLSPLAQAEVANVYEFDTAEQEQRFQDLIVELRCPKCQNQNIADSNAPISKDMRAEVYRRMRAGASNDEIVDALVARFGEFILYKPQVEKRTILLWATPAIAVLGGLLVVAGVVLRARRRQTEPEPALNAKEQARAAKILAEDDRDSNA
ncbi:cytochrome c-type biogenesis protein [Marinobacter qingdaonensis]|uniref:Cytochrome c-type biogenesis protein n=1 Tax=Marinobacter qingdaonensis TaxID=3108486 RepID=A0ABU5P0N6_9GAMM|nr:cytochrome c-type biogenesis protein [Marinobacter sp. ASW11-75]MEA1081562.1 cytochrome c-type biogenesis protein [Marinobacter sp. ASW11-75]